MFEFTYQETEAPEEGGDEFEGGDDNGVDEGGDEGDTGGDEGDTGGDGERPLLRLSPMTRQVVGLASPTYQVRHKLASLPHHTVGMYRVKEPNYLVFLFLLFV